VNESNGKFVLFTDDDTLVPNDWISRMVDAYQHCQHDALCGGFTPFSMDTDVERYLHYRMSILFGNRAKPIRAAPMMNFLLPRALFLKVGGFSSEYLPAAEDWEFCLRLRAQGYRIYYDPSISISHRYQTDWEGAGRRIQAAGEMGVRVCALRGKNVPVYTAYTCLRFIASPMWILRHYPMELYRKALKMEFAFCQARIAACMSHCRHS
jgi:GT2 family glycosyltransferase